MEWTPGGRNQDVEDREGDSGGGGGGFGLPHLGIGGIIVVGLLSLIFRQNFFALFSGASSTPMVQTRPATPANTREKQFMSFVLGDVQSTWDKLLPAQANIPYRHAKLVLFRNSYPSACGQAEDATGPFYCPEDEKVYLDTGFFDELKTRFGGSNAEFAQAYVVAHEVGHHVQKLLGIEAKVRRLQGQHPAQANPLSVDMELQADCFAGVWGHSARERHVVNTDEVPAALSAAAAVGDDRLQKMATGHVSPEKFTHGSAQQRTTWFERGLDSGLITSCNTFTRTARTRITPDTPAQQ
jgi:predicted metalloprotease